MAFKSSLGAVHEDTSAAPKELRRDVSCSLGTCSSSSSDWLPLAALGSDELKDLQAFGSSERQQSRILDGHGDSFSTSCSRSSAVVSSAAFASTCSSTAPSPSCCLSAASTAATGIASGGLASYSSCGSIGSSSLCCSCSSCTTTAPTTTTPTTTTPTTSTTFSGLCAVSSCPVSWSQLPSEEHPAQSQHQQTQTSPPSPIRQAATESGSDKEHPKETLHGPLGVFVDRSVFVEVLPEGATSAAAVQRSWRSGSGVTPAGWQQQAEVCAKIPGGSTSSVATSPGLPTPSSAAATSFAGSSSGSNVAAPAPGGARKGPSLEDKCGGDSLEAAAPPPSTSCLARSGSGVAAATHPEASTATTVAASARAAATARSLSTLWGGSLGSTLSAVARCSSSSHNNNPAKAASGARDSDSTESLPVVPQRSPPHQQPSRRRTLPRHRAFSSSGSRKSSLVAFTSLSFLWGSGSSKVWRQPQQQSQRRRLENSLNEDYRRHSAAAATQRRRSPPKFEAAPQTAVPEAPLACQVAAAAAAPSAAASDGPPAAAADTAAAAAVSAAVAAPSSHAPERASGTCHFIHTVEQLEKGFAEADERILPLESGEAAKAEAEGSQDNSCASLAAVAVELSIEDRLAEALGIAPHPRGHQHSSTISSRSVAAGDMAAAAAAKLLLAAGYDVSEGSSMTGSRRPHAGDGASPISTAATPQPLGGDVSVCMTDSEDSAATKFAALAAKAGGPSATAAAGCRRLPASPDGGSSTRCSVSEDSGADLAHARSGIRSEKRESVGASQVFGVARHEGLPGPCSPLSASVPPPLGMPCCCCSALQQQVRTGEGAGSGRCHECLLDCYEVDEFLTPSLSLLQHRSGAAARFSDTPTGHTLTVPNNTQEAA
ncbi:hypothetical protein cyc_07729 [Cyclospora cayetanensis]|uniref:Uncharacterized protein n=1 Tax=Cyclospora cayetanensis TaxID=88456 RepID=A0A1D3CQT7_9EIME|nr:hypothetical protein cyc_07729 [Cyclospora cayetanensis]